MFGTNPIANAANTAALLFQMMPDINWAGFYFLRDDKELVLSPFQGLAGLRQDLVGRGALRARPWNRGARSWSMTFTPPAVEHIACDAASRSELVVPLIREGRILGVLDLDSPVVGRFDAQDQAGVERLAAIYLAAGAD